MREGKNCFNTSGIYNCLIGGLNLQTSPSPTYNSTDHCWIRVIATYFTCIKNCQFQDIICQYRQGRNFDLVLDTTDILIHNLHICFHLEGHQTTFIGWWAAAKWHSTQFAWEGGNPTFYVSTFKSGEHLRMVVAWKPSFHLQPGRAAFNGM